MIHKRLSQDLGDVMTIKLKPIPLRSGYKQKYGIFLSLRNSRLVAYHALRAMGGNPRLAVQRKLEDCLVLAERGREEMT